MNSFFKKSRKIFFWFLGVIVFLYVSGALGQYWVPRIQEYLMNKRGEKMLAEWEAKKKAFEELEKQDFAGGKTPEETLQMTIEALKNKDVDKAVTYYKVNIREEARASLDREFSRSGDYNRSIEYYQSVLAGTKSCDEKNEGCTLRFKNYFYKDTVFPVKNSTTTFVIPKGGSLYRLVDMEKNPYTFVWKIFSI